MAQKLDLNGQLVWIKDMPVNQDSTRAFRGHPQAVALDASRVLVAWDDARRGLGTIDIMAQVIDDQGKHQWITDDRSLKSSKLG